MTVTYSLEVSRSKLCGFLKLLLRWKGSIYRLMYREMIIFAVAYYSIALLYRHLLPSAHQRNFEKISLYCREFTDLVPITFVLGFYVTLIVGRWWEQYLAIPWIDRAALQISAYLQGADEKGRMMRRALVRYLNLIMALTFQATSTVIKKRFPTLDHMEEAGILTVEERIYLEESNAPHGNWWVPTAWFANLAMEARKAGRIHDDLHLKSLIDEMMAFRGCCGFAWSYDWISVPLVYTQVVAISVYCFFGACLLGRQFLFQIPPGYEQLPSSDVDYFVPVFTLFQFFFYMGWLKVAEEMICPYGEDDDDFELNWVIDRNVQVGYAIVDDMYTKHPKLTRDSFWDETKPELPYTAAAAGYRREPYLGSTFDMSFNEKEMEWEMEMDPIVEGSEKNTPIRLGRSDVEIGVSPPPLSPRPPFGRPKFLNMLLKGTSRLSLQHSVHGSKYGSKNSVLSQRSRRDSRAGRSPTIFHRHKTALSARNNSRPSSHRHHRPSEAGESSLNGYLQNDGTSRPNSMYPSVSSRLQSLITLNDPPDDLTVPGSAFFVASPSSGLPSRQNSAILDTLPGNPGNNSEWALPVAGGSTCFGSEKDSGIEISAPSASIFIVEPVDISSPLNNVGVPEGTWADGSSLLEAVKVPPPITEVPEPKEHPVSHMMSNASAAYEPALETSEDKEDKKPVPALISDNGEKPLDENDFLETDDGSSGTDTEQKTVTSMSQLLPKSEQKNDSS